MEVAAISLRSTLVASQSLRFFSKVPSRAWCESLIDPQELLQHPRNQCLSPLEEAACSLLSHNALVKEADTEKVQLAFEICSSHHW